MKNILILLSIILLPTFAFSQVVNPGISRHGTITAGHCADWFSSNQIEDSGSACGGGGGAGTVTVVGSGNLNSTQIVTGGGAQTAQTPSANATIDASGNGALNSLTTGNGSTSGIANFGGKTSGHAALGVPDIAGTDITYMLPSTNMSAGQLVYDVGSATCGTYAAGFPATCHQLAGTSALPNGTTATTQAVNDNSTKVATTAFVQTQIASTVDIHDPVLAATNAVLLFSPSYSNGSSGVGATLTGTSFGILIIDGYTVNLNDRVLVQNQAATLQNGCYTLTTVGTVAADYVLTRCTDYNQTSEIVYGSTFPVLQGTLNANQQFTMNNNNTITVGTTGITFAQTSGGSQLTGGQNITITGNSIAVSGQISTTNGGLGVNNSAATGLPFFSSGTAAVTPICSYLTTDFSVTSSTTLTNSGLSLAYTTSKQYLVIGTFNFTGSGGFKIAPSLGGGSENNDTALWTVNNAGTQVFNQGGLFSTINDTTADLVSLQGSWSAASTGTITIQIAQNSSNATPIKLKAGSSFCMLPIN